MSTIAPPLNTRLPVLELLHPREQTGLVAAALVAGVALGAAGMRWLGWPLWVATALALGVLLIPGALKWRADGRRYGRTVMVLSILLVTQGFHTVEHSTQWVQFHILGLSARASSGLLSAANSEWVHFVWNWTVLVVVVYLVSSGMRNPWAWLLLAWAAAHTVEHTYMFVRFLQVSQELNRLGPPSVSAQGLPGILGLDGWLARSPVTQGTLLCRVPGLTTAPRLDVHFWWNAGEITLLLLAAHVHLRSPGSQRDTRERGPGQAGTDAH